MSFGELFGLVAADLVHPPLFYVFLKIWVNAGGESLVWLRSFPIVFAVLSLVPLNFLCREFGLSKFGAVIAFTLVATNGCLINYAQEVRMYSQFLFFALVSMWLFMRFLRLGKNIWLLTIVNVLLVYTHYFGWLTVACEVAAIVALQRIKFRQIAIMTGIAVLSFIPWLLELRRASIANGELSRNIGWIDRPNAETLIQFAIDLVEPFFYPLSTSEPASVYIVAIPLLLTLLVALFAFFATAEFEESTERLRVLAIFIALPVAAAFAASWIMPHAVWGTRHLIIVFVPVAILFARAFDGLTFRGLRAALTISVAVLIPCALIVEIGRSPARHIWCAWEDLAPKADATVYVFEDPTAYSMWFAKRGQNIDVVRVTGIEGIPQDRQFFLPRRFDGVSEINVDEITAPRFFVAFRARYFDKNKPPLSEFSTRGYKLGPPQVFDADDETGYLVEVKR